MFSMPTKLARETSDFHIGTNSMLLPFGRGVRTRSVQRSHEPDRTPRQTALQSALPSGSRRMRPALRSV